MISRATVAYSDVRTYSEGSSEGIHEFLEAKYLGLDLG
jgi:hypothetical protein